MIRGREYWVSGRTPEEAEDKIAIIRDEGASRGRVPTLAEWLPSWLETRISLKPSTFKRYKSDVDLHLVITGISQRTLV